MPFQVLFVAYQFQFVSDQVKFVINQVEFVINQIEFVINQVEFVINEVEKLVKLPKLVTIELLKGRRYLVYYFFCMCFRFLCMIVMRKWKTNWCFIRRQSLYFLFCFVCVSGCCV